MALTNSRCCFNLQLILGHVTSLSTCLFSTWCLSKQDPALRYPDRRRKQISFPQERESVTGKHIQKSPCLPWRPVWEKGVEARSLQSCAAGILACGYSWLPQGSAPCTQLRICCIMSVGKYIKGGDRESLLLQLDVRLENAGFQLISHTELQGRSIADPDLEPDFRICSQLCDHIDLATNTSIITKIKKKKSITEEIIIMIIKSHFLILIISCPFLKVIFFKVRALTGVDRSVQRILQCFILSCRLQKFHPLILLTSVQLGCSAPRLFMQPLLPTIETFI